MAHLVFFGFSGGDWFGSLALFLLFLYLPSETCFCSFFVCFLAGRRRKKKEAFSHETISKRGDVTKEP